MGFIFKRWGGDGDPSGLVLCRGLVNLSLLSLYGVGTEPRAWAGEVSTLPLSCTPTPLSCLSLSEIHSGTIWIQISKKRKKEVVNAENSLSGMDEKDQLTLGPPKSVCGARGPEF